MGLKSRCSLDFDQELIPAKPLEEFIAMQQREKIGKALKNEVETRFRDLQDLIQVEVGEKEVTIRLMGETTFDSGKADIKAQMVPLLLKIGGVLADGKGEVIIAGHTDNVPVHGGPYGSNLKLSIARAATVAEFLLAKSAIPASRLSTMGFGNTDRSSPTIRTRAASAIGGWRSSFAPPTPPNPARPTFLIQSVGMLPS